MAQPSCSGSSHRYLSLSVNSNDLQWIIVLPISPTWPNNCSNFSSNCIKKLPSFTTEVDSAIGPLHCEDVSSVANISEVYGSSSSGSKSQACMKHWQHCQQPHSMTTKELHKQVRNSKLFFIISILIPSHPTECPGQGPKTVNKCQNNILYNHSIWKNLWGWVKR
jgi:hypothetical protein